MAMEAMHLQSTQPCNELSYYMSLISLVASTTGITQFLSALDPAIIVPIVLLIEPVDLAT